MGLGVCQWQWMSQSNNEWSGRWDNYNCSDLAWYPELWKGPFFLINSQWTDEMIGLVIDKSCDDMVFMGSLQIRLTNEIQELNYTFK